jgi:arylsulfatase A-like enzyme
MEEKNRLSRREFLKISGAGLLSATLAGSNLHPWIDNRRTVELPQSAQQSPNILLIVLDTVRTKSLGLYGYSRETSPNLELLSKQGVFFKRAYSSSPWTLPSHAGMFTGHYPNEVTADWRTPLDASFPTLAEVLQEQGYQTAGFVGNNAYCITEYGLHRGFEHYEDFRKSPGQIALGSSIVRTATEVLDLREKISTYNNFGRKSAEQLNHDFLSWLGKRDLTHPFFAFLNYYDAHDPYLPPRDYAMKIAQRDVRGYYNESKPKKLTSDEILTFKDAYEASIAYLDDQIGRLFSQLTTSGNLNNTLVIIVSDHGEQFGEHGLIFHGNSLYHLLLHVPLILIHPSLLPEGKIIEQPVSLVNIPNTILDLIGKKSDSIFPGKSLTQYWQGFSKTEVIHSNVKISWDMNNIPMVKGWKYSKILENWHYILNADLSEELYLVNEDPDELMNLKGEGKYREVLKKFRESSQ